MEGWQMSSTDFAIIGISLFGMATMNGVFKTKTPGFGKRSMGSDSIDFHRTSI
jgi:hypothetical protein